MQSIIINKDQIDAYYNREWLVTNGIGGFACGTLGGVLSRKYHSYLNAALPAPHGRTNMLNYIADEVIISDEKSFPLNPIRLKNSQPASFPHLIEYRLEYGMPIWKYECEGVIIEKSLSMIYKQNTIWISYKVIESSSPITIKWRPYFHFCSNEQSVNIQIPNESYNVKSNNFDYEIECPNFPTLRLYNDSLPTFTVDLKIMDDVFYEIEAKRGYESIGKLTSPGFFSIDLSSNTRSTFFVSTEPWITLQAIPPGKAWHIEKLRKKNLLKMANVAANKSAIPKLVLAADQFLMTPMTRYQDMIRLQASGEEVRSVIAGFPWFTDWGRDTMISLEGLTLCTGRYRDAYAILHTFAYYVKDGLIPNMFPDGKIEGIYNTADATLWFFHAIDRYVEITKDAEIIEYLLPILQEIINAHLKGTNFGIKADLDGLLIQGQEGYQLTWMDAKVGDWVVTPRRGKAVEINALWYNALKLYETWSGKSLEITAKCFESFNQKFWNPQTQYLNDVIEGGPEPDPALRPNQLFAISLKYPVLKEEHWKPVLERVKKELLTPMGLRTLAPSHPEYKNIYDGDLITRDAAYHQGTVWPWLLGPFVDCWLKVYPEDKSGARTILKGLEECLNSNPLGSIGEIFDGSDPYHERGCFAQAWSVAELLRALIKSAE